MRMRLVVMAAILVAAIVAGIVTIKGPFDARHLKLDQRRYADLSNIARALRCPSRKAPNPALPADLTVESLRAYCGGWSVRSNHLVDVETGKPYRYDRRSDRDFALCADFHNAEKLDRLTITGRHETAFDPETGCIVGRVD